MELCEVEGADECFVVRFQLLDQFSVILPQPFLRGGRAGVVAEGAYADLIVVEGDPLADIGVLAGGRSLRLILADGDPVRPV